MRNAAPSHWPPAPGPRSHVLIHRVRLHVRCKAFLPPPLPHGPGQLQHHLLHGQGGLTFSISNKHDHQWQKLRTVSTRATHVSCEHRPARVAPRRHRTPEAQERRTRSKVAPRRTHDGLRNGHRFPRQKSHAGPCAPVGTGKKYQAGGNRETQSPDYKSNPTPSETHTPARGVWEAVRTRGRTAVPPTRPRTGHRRHRDT